MKDSLCAICGGKIREKTITIDRMSDDHLYLFEDVQVRVCNQCGEIWIPGNLAEKMDRAINGKIKPRKKIAVPVF